MYSLYIHDAILRLPKGPIGHRMDQKENQLFLEALSESCYSSVLYVSCKAGDCMPYGTKERINPKSLQNGK